MKIISIINRKGGTGKTTSTFNIGAGMARKGKKVLLFDLDSQCNLSRTARVYGAKDNIFEAMRNMDQDVQPELPIVELKENLDIVPGSKLMSDLERKLGAMIGKEHFLRNLIEPIKGDYDFILLDCPPSLGLETQNALIASHSVLIPTEAEDYSYSGLDDILGVMKGIKKHYNQNLALEGVFLTKLNKNRNISKSFTSALENQFSELFLKTRIRYSVSFAESQLAKQDIFEYDSESNSAKDYSSLVDELLSK